MSSTTCAGGVVQPAWDNHFEAFSKKDVEQILLDYCEESVINSYDMKTGRNDAYTGIDGAKVFATELFASLPDLSTLGAPVVDVNEGPEGSVFLVWKCPSSGIEFATDSFLFDTNGKILKQTVAVWKASPTDGTSTNTDPTGGRVQASWDNHFAAFGAKSVPKILLDYTEDSIITTYMKNTDQKAIFKGLAGVEEVYSYLFKNMSDLSDLGPLCVQVTENPGAVFIVWQCPSSQIAIGQDTIFFDENAKIKYQNVVVEKLKVDVHLLQYSGVNYSV